MSADTGPISRPLPAGPQVSPRGGSGPLALLRALRVKQWTKNVLVLSAPVAAGVLNRAGPLTRVLVAFVAFCLVASGGYLVNDVLDRDADRLHPTKRHRPIAAGGVSPPAAVATAVALVAGGLGMAAGVGWQLVTVLLVYLAVTLAYSTFLKNVAVMDLGCVASGFVLRTIAGGVAADVPISRWFLIVAGAGSLFMVSGKRQADLIQLGATGASVRATLGQYTVPYLRFVTGVAAAVAISAYSMWAFEGALLDINPVAAQLSVVPFVLGMLRYALVIELGGGGAPEDVVLGDWPLLLIGLSWLAVFAFGVHLGR